MTKLKRKPERRTIEPPDLFDTVLRQGPYGEEYEYTYPYADNEDEANQPNKPNPNFEEGGETTDKTRFSVS